MTLTDCIQGKSFYIASVKGSGAFRARLGEMGFVRGQAITRLYNTPANKQIVVELMGSRIALRRKEAQRISVSDEPVLTEPKDESFFEENLEKKNECTITSCFAEHQPTCNSCNTHYHCSCSKNHRNNVAPTSDETITIALIGNPNSGKTSLFNAICGGHERTGNYSGVTVCSTVGQTVFKQNTLRIIDLPGTYSLRAFSPEEAYVAHELEKGHIDAVINVLDATNLERNLLLTLQLRERKVPMVGALNMYDELEKSESHLDIRLLEERMGMSFCPTVGRNGKGKEKLLDKAIQIAQEARNGEQKESMAHPCTAHRHSDRHQDENCPCPEREHDDELRYQQIRQLLQNVYTRCKGPTDRFTDLADKILANRWTAYPLFFLVMGFIFWATFILGAWPMEWIDNGIGLLAETVGNSMSEGALRDLITDGIIGGVGSVIVFLPNILILYFFISLLEDSGYLARTAMLADPFLNRMGLHGKSFIPMLTGFGCNVPAIMATRTIEDHKSRLITMLVIPFMSCSARIPVYVILAGAFFPKHAALVLFGLYLLGILLALLSAWMLSRIYKREQESSFVMEIPPYRLPAWKGILRHTWEKGRQYLHKMGGIILVASIIVWALGYFPRPEQELSDIEQQEQSYMGQIGHALEPVIRPLGYDWRMGVGIMAGVGAKELMISTLGVLYQVPEEENSAETVAAASSTRLAQVLAASITPQAALSYMVFALLYFPCLATIAAIAGESGHWKWAFFTMFYTTALAYIVAFIVYRIAFWF